jgi:tetratricopeptide (TPR) repeat protein
MGERQTVGLDGSRCALLVPFVLLALSLVPVSGATAQETAAACSPAIGRIVSIQGNVEIQRSGQKEWVAVKRLDTTLCAEDRLRTDAESRAGVFLQPETMVRVDQNTVIRLKQADDEIEVQFFGAELADNLRNAQPSGGGYFITRFPKKFKVTTPHMNAAVEGTEFMVQITPDATKLTVLEGKVSSQSVATGNTQLVEAGQSVSSGAAGPSTIETVVKPQDAVQWVLRYPPISDQSDTSGISRAEHFLRSGSVEEALVAIDAELAANPLSSDAHALRAVIEVAKNDKVGALDSAGQATELGPENYRAWLALSYALQAGFELDAALESARKARAIRVDSALANARVAELLLSLGDTKRAEDAARAAIAANSGESYGHSILGFVHLAELDTKAARNDFDAAIERDSFAALPRMGRGLGKIRDGELIEGREELEVAVALDPSNALLRSYVGKAYYEERTAARSTLAGSQFDLAKVLDPKDPTPWLYDAIRLQTANRPAEAVGSLQRSIELNDNRAVYRSRQLLVEDNAVRSVSLARAYQEVGFDQLAVLESAVSISSDPGNTSAHRFLADSYLVLPRHEIARRSELLQAQLLQAPNAVPIQPQLTEDNFFILRGAGPTVAGFYEFTPLFTQKGVTTQADVVAGNLGTWGDQIIFSGLGDRTGFAVSQLAYETDGFRADDDFSKRAYTGFIQFEPSTHTGVQAEFRHSESEFGNLLQTFDPELPSIFDERHDLRDSRVRFGFHDEFGAGSDLILSVAAIDQQEKIALSGEPAIDQNIRSYVGEVQHILTRDQFNFVTGLGYIDETQNTSFFGSPDRFSPFAAYAYGYANFSPFGNANLLHVGASVDYLADEDDIAKSRTRVNPKLGVTFSPWKGATLRAATFEVLRRQFADSQTIEPTQVAGFNQFYDDFSATESRRSAIAIDQSLTQSLYLGAGFSRRDLKVPQDQTGEVFNWDERDAAAHVYWSPNDVFSLTFGWEYEKFRRPEDFPGRELIAEIETRTLPATITVHLRNMVFAQLKASHVEQSGRIFTLQALPDTVPADESFWIADAGFGYRLPNRLGTLSVDMRNIFDQNYRFQETDLFSRRYAPERTVLLRASIAF